MAQEANKVWDATVSLIRTTVEKGEAKPQEVKLFFEGVFTPGANQVGMMIFQSATEASYIPLQQIIQIDLKARPAAMIEVPKLVVK